jgi:DegV family protein with EDD domain
MRANRLMEGDGLRTLSGREFAQVLRSGTHAVLRHEDLLDRINVFPVADADTGANLAATLTAAAGGLAKNPPADIGTAVGRAADAAIAGARGNSGAILAQFFQGLAEGVRQKRTVATTEFATAVTLGVDAAYDAVQRPREGTILSVFRAWAQELESRARMLPDFPELLSHAFAAAQQALDETPRQLEVLARHRVVDAGGQGLVYFLEGMLDVLRGHTPIPASVVQDTFVPAAYRSLGDARGARTGGFVPVAPGSADLRIGDLGDRHPRYCVELVLSGREVTREAVQKMVGSLGESLVVVGDRERVRVHLHTDDPGSLETAAARLGRVAGLKVDDMIAQRAAARTAKIALVTDSTFDLPEAGQLRYGTIMVPLHVSLAGTSFLDRIDLDRAGFYKRFRDAGQVARSSQPNALEFERVYSALLEDNESVISVHLSGRLSGTVQSAATAAERVDATRIRVVDSRQVSVGLGLVVQAAGEAILAGGTLDSVAAAAEAAARDTRVYGTVPSLEVAVKGGRVSARLARFAGLIELKPIIAFDEQGGAYTDGGHLGFSRAIRGVADRVARFAAGGPARVAIAHADGPEAAQYLWYRLRLLLGDIDIPILEAGSVITAHVGLGAVAVAVQRISGQIENGGGVG